MKVVILVVVYAYFATTTLRYEDKKTVRDLPFGKFTSILLFWPFYMIKRFSYKAPKKSIYTEYEDMYHIQGHYDNAYPEGLADIMEQEDNLITFENK